MKTLCFFLFTCAALAMAALPAEAQILGTLQADDEFGRRIATGDFNGDGYDDIVVGAPREDVGSEANAGAVNVAYGSGSGLQTAGNQWLTQPLLPLGPEANDDFGQYVASGDFDGDGYDDLAVGVPDEDHSGATDAGAVNIFYGSASGLATTGAQVFVQPSLPNGPEDGDQFGLRLASGDFDDDGYDDLAVGAPFEEVGGDIFAGAVNAFYGSASGLTSTGAQVFVQPSLPNGPEPLDTFGFALASGDYDGDGYDDLAVGAPGEDHSGATGAGVFNAFYGSASGLTTAGAQVFVQPSLPNGPEDGDGFGRALASGDFDGDGYDDIAVGVYLEDVGSVSPIANAGAFNVFYGSGSGLTSSGAQVFTDSAGGVEAGDWFGWSLASGDFNADGYDDLAVGSRKEDIDGAIDAGAANGYFGSASGLRSAGSRQGSQNDPTAIRDVSEAGDEFGFSLAVGDFNGDGRDDVAIGVPFEDLSGQSDAGAVHVIRGASSGIGFTLAGQDFAYQGGNWRLAGGSRLLLAEEERGAEPFMLDAVEAGLLPPAPTSAAVRASAATVIPNPFTRETQIAFTIDTATHVRLSIYDALGRETAVLIDHALEAGRHTMTFDARTLTPGTYVWRIVAGRHLQTGRMTLVR